MCKQVLMAASFVLLICGEMMIGSRLERGLLGYITYFLAFSLCAVPKRKHFFWD